MDPGPQAEDTLWSSLYGGDPYGSPMLGTLASLDSLSVPVVRDFYLAHWRPDHAVLAVAGDVEPDSVFAAAAVWFRNWERRESPAEPTAGDLIPRPRTRVLERARAASESGRAAETSLSKPFQY